MESWTNKINAKSHNDDMCNYNIQTMKRLLFLFCFDFSLPFSFIFFSLIRVYFYLQWFSKKLKRFNHNKFRLNVFVGCSILITSTIFLFLNYETKSCSTTVKAEKESTYFAIVHTYNVSSHSIKYFTLCFRRNLTSTVRLLLWNRIE